MTDSNLTPTKSKKMTPEALQFVLQAIAVYKPNKWILGEIKRLFNINIESISGYKKTKAYKPIIAERRKEFEASLAQVPISSKRMRLERLEGLYQLSMQWLLKKECSIAEVSSLLVKAREELEGKAVLGNVYQFNQYNKYDSMSDSELLEKLDDNYKSLKRLKISSTPNGDRIKADPIEGEVTSAE